MGNIEINILAISDYWTIIGHHLGDLVKTPNMNHDLKEKLDHRFVQIHNGKIPIIFQALKKVKIKLM